MPLPREVLDFELRDVYGHPHGLQFAHNDEEALAESGNIVLEGVRDGQETEIIYVRTRRNGDADGRVEEVVVSDCNDESGAVQDRQYGGAG